MKTVKLPFPLTIKFKSMLQAGVATRDMDPRWMSSISWYFLCIFGLQSVFNFLLGNDNGMFYAFSLTRFWLTFAQQPQARWRNKWARWDPPKDKCLVPVLIPISNSLPRPRTSLSLSTTQCLMVLSSVCSRVSRCRFKAKAI